MAVRHPDDLTHTMTVPGNATITTDAVVPLVRITRPGVVNSVEFLANAAQSGADTHSRTFRLYNRGQAGAGTALVASLALTSGVDLAAYVAKAITLGAAADRVVAVGDVLVWDSLHVGNGILDAGGLVIVQQSLGT